MTFSISEKTEWVRFKHLERSWGVKYPLKKERRRKNEMTMQISGWILVMRRGHGRSSFHFYFLCGVAGWGRIGVGLGWRLEGIRRESLFGP